MGEWVLFLALLAAGLFVMGCAMLLAALNKLDKLGRRTRRLQDALAEVVGQLRRRVRDQEPPAVTMASPPEADVGPEPTQPDEPPPSAAAAEEEPAGPVPIRLAQSPLDPLVPRPSLPAHLAVSTPPEAAPAEIGEMAQATGRPRAQIEVFLGRKLLAWTGMLALLMASVLFIIWAHQQHRLDDRVKVLIHVGAGLLLLALGEWASRRKWTPLARTLTGGGIAELLFANFAALALYDLIGLTVFLVFMAAVIALAIALALWYDSRTISIIATLAGVAVPMMLYRTDPDFRLVFAFLACVDASVMILAGLRRWPAVNIIAFLGTVLNILVWLYLKYGFDLLSQNHPDGIEPLWAVVTLGGFFVLFLAVSLIYNLVRRGERKSDLSVFLINPLWAYATTYVLFNDDYHAHMAPLSASLGALYLMLGMAVRRRMPDTRQLYTMGLALGVGFIALAAPIQFDGMAVIMCFALLAALLYVAAEQMKEIRFRIAGLVVYVLLGLWLVSAHGDMMERTARLILNQRLATLAACAASLMVTALVIRRGRLRHPLALGSAFAAVPSLIAHVLILLAFTAETADFYSRQGLAAHSMEARLVCSLGYALYAAGLLLTGFLTRRYALRIAALVLFALTVMKVFTLDARYVFMDHERTIFNLRCALLVVCVVCLAMAALLMRRRPTGDQLFGEADCAAVPALFAHAFALLLLTLETKTFFAHYEDVAATYLSRQMTYSILYAVYAAGLLAAGFVFRRLYLRAAGLLLFAGLLAKIMLYDLSRLRDLYRVASVFALAVLLLAGAYLYNKYQHLLLPQEPKDEGGELDDNQATNRDAT